MKHPHRVSHLILYGGYALGANLLDDPPTARDTFRAVREVMRLGWGSNNPTFRQLFTSRFAPGGTQAQLDWFNELCRRTVPPDNACALMDARGDVDVRALLPLVRAPTLVLHAPKDAVVPFSQGRYLAGNVPGAEFIQLDSGNHVLLENEPAWAEFRRAVLEFTGLAATTPQELSALSRREHEILALLCEGHSNAQIGWKLGISEKTVRNHVSRLYAKMGVRSRSEAIVHTHRHGLPA